MCPLGSGTIDRVVGPHVPGVTAFLGVDESTRGYLSEILALSSCDANGL